MIYAKASSQRDVVLGAGAAAKHGATGHAPADVHGIVLAGVHSWGDCVLDDVICRPALPVAGRPLICHCLEWLRNQGVRTVSLCANSDTGYLRRCLHDGREMGLTLEYYEDVMPRGPAGSLRDAAVVSSAQLFVVMYGTVVPRIDLASALRAHEAAGACATVIATRNRMSGGGSDDLQPAGVCLFARSALDYIPTKGYQDIKESLFPRLHAEGRHVITHIVEKSEVGHVMDTSSYISVCRSTVERISRQSRFGTGYVRAGEAWVHETACVSPTALLIGPVIVEPGCTVENEAMIIGPTTIGPGSVVGARAVISRSIVWSGCRIGADAILDDCVLTDGTLIEDELVMRNTVCMQPGAQRTGPVASSKFPLPLDKPTLVQPGSKLAARTSPPRARATAAATVREIVACRPVSAGRPIAQRGPWQGEGND